MSRVARVALVLLARQAPLGLEVRQGAQAAPVFLACLGPQGLQARKVLQVLVLPAATAKSGLPVFLGLLACLGLPVRPVRLVSAELPVRKVPPARQARRALPG